MSAVTWALGGYRQATVFCVHCWAVFASDVDLGEATSCKARATADHYCTPPKPWRPK